MLILSHKGSNLSLKRLTLTVRFFFLLPCLTNFPILPIFTNSLIWFLLTYNMKQHLYCRHQILDFVHSRSGLTRLITMDLNHDFLLISVWCPKAVLVAKSQHYWSEQIIFHNRQIWLICLIWKSFFVNLQLIYLVKSNSQPVTLFFNKMYILE